MLFANYPKGWLFILLLLWVLPWKGIALWKASKNDQMGWFIAIMIVNTVGILEILYILFFSKKHENNILEG